MSTELNGQIAKLLGWTLSSERMSQGIIDFWKDERGHVVACQEDWGPANGIDCTRWDPLGEIAHADFVLDRIGKLGWMVTVYVGPHPGYDGPINRVCIMRGPQDFVLGGVDVIADTRPLAICQAFVEAMERWSK